MEENNNEYQCTCECCISPEQLRAMWRELIIKLVVAIVLLITGWAISEYTTLPYYTYLICFGISYILVGFDIVRDAIVGILEGNIFNENLLMTIASLGAFAIKEYSEGCAVVILYTIGEMLQVKALDKSRTQLVESIGENHQPIQSTSEKFITRFARVYTPIVCIIALAIVLIPPLFMHGVWNEWIHRGLSALVVSCPCAIVVSVPLCFFGGIGACSKNGIYMADSICIEKMRKYDDATSEENVVNDGIVINDFSSEKVAIGKKIAKKTMRLAYENIIISIGVKLIILVMSVFLSKEIPMWLAAFGDVGICLIAILNSLRALKK